MLKYRPGHFVLVLSEQRTDSVTKYTSTDLYFLFFCHRGYGTRWSELSVVNIKSLGSNRDANLLYRCKERRKEIVLVDYL